jgi:hypothetical protein
VKLKLSLIIFLLQFAAELAFAFPDPMSRGNFAFQSGEYKFPATRDADVLDHADTEIWAKAFWPKDLSKPRPILFFLHGNHGTCGFPSVPRDDVSCQYTEAGTCPAGMVVTPNHEGYDYLGEHLASHGYIVVSINANRGITCGSGTPEDWGLNLARGRLILRHIEEWRHWSASGGAPASLGIPPRFFVGAVDLENVGLFGHSRGGEGARAAYNLYRDHGSPWQKRIPGLDIKGIFEIGAVDGQTSRVLDADDTAWNQLLPMCDGDVYDLQGRLPFERMILKSTERRKKPKSLYLAWGTNHNFFNTQWHQNDAFDGCLGHDPIWDDGSHVSSEQQRVAIGSVSAFFLTHVGSERHPLLGSVFDPSYALPLSIAEVTRVERDFVPTFDHLVNVKLEDFDQPTGTNSHRTANLARGIDIEHVNPGLPPDPEDIETSLHPLAKVSWRRASPDNFLQINWSPEGEGLDALAFDTLDFRVSRQSLHLNPLQSTNFSVALVDENGTLSQTVPVERYAWVLGPVSATTVFQTVRIPVADFELNTTTKIRGARLVFDQSPSGDLYLANVRFSGTLAPVGLRPARMDSREKPSRTALSFSRASAHSTARQSIKKPHEFQAKVLGWRKTKLARFDGREETVEVSVRSDERFPVEAQIPVLVMNGKFFSVSRYDAKDGIKTLIFTVPLREVEGLPPKGKMHIQYGLQRPNKVWRLPNYSKSEFMP